MKHLLAIVGFVFVVGCGSKGGGDKIISDYTGLKDRMCKCADKACAEKVTADAVEWMGTMEKEMKNTKPTKEQDEKFDKIDDEMKACAKKLGAEGL
ncbi:MAG: hypothetical protein JWP01_3860 [Myxococcales bacterium]|nr:hypothetical protein [Myxococcales bacterium]